MICSRLHAFIRCSYYSFSIAKIMINAYGNMEKRIWQYGKYAYLQPLWFMVQYRIGCAMKGISLNITDGSSTRNVFPVMSRPEIADQSSS